MQNNAKSNLSMQNLIYESKYEIQANMKMHGWNMMMKSMDA